MRLNFRDWFRTKTSREGVPQVKANIQGGVLKKGLFNLGEYNCSGAADKFSSSRRGDQPAVLEGRGPMGRNSSVQQSAGKCIQPCQTSGREVLAGLHVPAAACAPDSSLDVAKRWVAKVRRAAQRYAFSSRAASDPESPHKTVDRYSTISRRQDKYRSCRSGDVRRYRKR